MVVPFSGTARAVPMLIRHSLWLTITLRLNITAGDDDQTKDNKQHPKKIMHIKIYSPDNKKKKFAQLRGVPLRSEMGRRKKTTARLDY
jgi:hypothetical protein